MVIAKKALFYSNGMICIMYSQQIFYEWKEFPKQNITGKQFLIAMCSCYTCASTNHKLSLADLAGGGRHAMGPNSFIFAYIFTEKHLRRRSTTPLMGACPPHHYGKSWICYWLCNLNYR